MKSYFTPAVALFLLIANTAQAQTSDEYIEETLVTASPYAKTEAEIAGSVNVLNSEALQREASATLGETLKNQLGVHSSSFGPGVGVPIIRGQSGNRVEILQNNTVIGDVSDISADHAVGTEALLASRIEILRGPATLRFGSGAIGGVVNVIDHRIDNQAIDGVEGAVEVRYDTNNEEDVVVGVLDAGNGNVSLHLDGVTRSGDVVEIPGAAMHEFDDEDETSFGFIENSDREADSFGLGLSFIGDNVIAGFSVNQLDNQYGIPPGAHGHHEEEGHDEEEEHDEDEEHHDEEEEHHDEEEVFVRLDMEQTLYQGKLSFINLGGNLEALNIDLSLTDYQHAEVEIHSEEEGHEEEEEDHDHEEEGHGTIFDNETLDLRAELLHKEVAGWIGAFGLQIKQTDFSAVGEEAFVEPSETDVLGLYLIEEAEIGEATVEFGLRYDDQSISYEGGNLDHDSLNLSASYIHRLDDSGRISLILSRAERNPVALELLAEGEHLATATYEIGDSTLGTESSTNMEITWTYATDSLNARASIYHSDFDGYIYERDTELRFSHDLEEDDGLTGLDACSDDVADFHDEEEFEEALECFVFTQEDATFYGIEAEAGFSLTQDHSLRLWGDMVRATLDQSGDVPRMPPARLGASWDYDSGNWSAQLSVTHALDQDRAGEGQEETEGYTRLDAYVGYNLENLSIFLKGENLTDEEIRNSTSFTRELAPEPGLGFTLGARYNF